MTADDLRVLAPLRFGEFVWRSRVRAASPEPAGPDRTMGAEAVV